MAEESNLGQLLSPNALVCPRDFKRRVALVIGIDSYESDIWRNLGGAVNDAEKVHQALISVLGFSESEIELIIDPVNATRDRLLAAIDRFVSAAEDDTFMFFHYCGYGMSVLGRDFMIPSDSRSFDYIYDKSIDRGTAAEIVQGFTNDIVPIHRLEGCAAGKHANQYTLVICDSTREDLAAQLATLASHEQGTESNEMTVEQELRRISNTARDFWPPIDAYSNPWIHYVFACELGENACDTEPNFTGALVSLLASDWSSNRPIHSIVTKASSDVIEEQTSHHTQVAIQHVGTSRPFGKQVCFKKSAAEAVPSSRPPKRNRAN